MTAALQTTFETLSTSRNESALPVLIGVLENTEGAIYDLALKSLITRRNRAGHFAVISRWHQLSEAQRELVREGRGKMSAALRDGVLSEEEQVFKNACEIIKEFGEFDLVSTLVTLAENKRHPHAAVATDLVVRMVGLLSEMVHGKRESGDRRDPQMIRSHVMEGLERSVERFRDHQRTELIEAFVVLGGASSSLLRTILEDPHHACYLTVVHTLSTSQSTAVVKLLLSFLESEHASLASLMVISKRTDMVFLKQLLDFVGSNFNNKVKKNVGRIRNFSWLQGESLRIHEFEEEDQAHAVRLVAASGIKQELLLDLLEELLRDGKAASRLAACEEMASIQGERPNQLILDATEDLDPLVQAAATAQLRDRHVPGAMGMLMKLLDCPHEVVRQAARQSLSEFSFENFLSQFDGLDEESRHSTGSLVCKVDLEVKEKLTAQLESPSRRNRLRAIEIVEVMELASEISEALIGRLEDSDHLIRAAAADVLQYCPTVEAKQALQRAASDRSSAVQSAAKSSLTVLSELSLPAGAASPMESQR